MTCLIQTLNARLRVGANPYIGSRRIFVDRQALAGRPGSDLSTRERRHPLVPVGPPRTLGSVAVLNHSSAVAGFDGFVQWPYFEPGALITPAIWPDADSTNSTGPP